MASDAEIDLVVNASRALTDAQREIDRLIRVVQNSTDPIQIRTALDQRDFLRSQLPQLQANLRQAEARLRAVNWRIEVDEDSQRRLNSTIDNLVRTSTSAAGVVGRLGATIGSMGLAAGSAVPLLAGVVGAVQNLVPAAAVATQGILTLQLATNTLKIGMIGVGEAIETAFDPEAKPEDLAKAMERLAPEAREFVQQLRDMRGAFEGVRLGVQNRLFRDLSDGVELLGREVLPTLDDALDRSALALNGMATGAIEAALQLQRDGTLGRAISGSVVALENLEGVPGRLVTAFGQLAAASAPAFDRITTAIANVVERAGDSLTRAFESGRLEESINTAIDAIAQLGRIFGNVFEGIGNIIGGVTSNGEGLFFILEKITQAFADVTASEGFQDALLALVRVASTLVSSALPLLEQALKALGPIFETLGPPVEDLIRVLGAALGPVIEALTPVLTALAGAIGALVPIITPFIELAGELISRILPVLTPLFEALQRVFEAMAPFARQLADSLGQALAPVLDELVPTIEQLLPPFVEFAERIFPILTDAVIALTPALVELSTILADLLVAATPLIVAFLDLSNKILEDLTPYIGPLTELLGDLATGGMQVLADVINSTVVPAIEAISQLLTGDFSGALDTMQERVSSTTSTASSQFTSFRDRVNSAVTGAIQATGRFLSDLSGRFTSGVRSAVDRVNSFFTALPGRITGALSGLPGRLLSIGQNIVQGLINGLSNGLARLRSKVAEIAETVRDGVAGLLGIHSPSTVMIAFGKDTVDGLMIGLEQRLSALRSTVGAVAATIPTTMAAGVGPVTALPSSSGLASPVNVYIGAERLDERIDYRVSTQTRRDTRTLAQGVRR